MLFYLKIIFAHSSVNEEFRFVQKVFIKWGSILDRCFPFFVTGRGERKKGKILSKTERPTLTFSNRKEGKLLSFASREIKRLS